MFIYTILSVIYFSCVTRCPRQIQDENLTLISEFFLMQISEDPDLRLILFGLFLSIYMVTVLGNLLIILLIITDSHLHTPMYFFLCNLSLADICFISTTVPKIIVNIQTDDRGISYAGCLTQMSVNLFFACMDDMLLTVMAYDRFIAICHPLHYSVIMNPHRCAVLILVSFFLSIVDSQVNNLFVLQFTNVKDEEISNFFCDPSHVINLVCSDSYSTNIFLSIMGSVFGFLPVSAILFSYYKIVSNIMKISSTGGRYKAFSTCGSHLTVVCLFYGTIIGVYLGAAASGSPRKVMVATVIYAVVTPMLNPFIYSLRNKDIQSALRRIYSRKIFPR